VERRGRDSAPRDAALKQRARFAVTLGASELETLHAAIGRALRDAAPPPVGRHGNGLAVEVELHRGGRQQGGIAAVCEVRARAS
jgi:hypothetical protein